MEDGAQGSSKASIPVSSYLCQRAQPPSDAGAHLRGQVPRRESLAFRSSVSGSMPGGLSGLSRYRAQQRLGVSRPLEGSRACRPLLPEVSERALRTGRREPQPPPPRPHQDPPTCPLCQRSQDPSPSCCVTQDKPLHLSGLCCSCPSERWDEPGPPLPCPAPLEGRQYRKLSSTQPRPEGRAASALWAQDLPTSDSAFLHHFHMGRRGPQPRPTAPKLAWALEAPAARYPPGPDCTLPAEGLRTEAGKAPRMQWGAGGEDAGIQAPIPPFKTSAVSTLCPAVSCKATRVEGTGAASESPIQLSCLGWGPALSLDPREAFPGVSAPCSRHT